MGHINLRHRSWLNSRLRSLLRLRRITSSITYALSVWLRPLTVRRSVYLGHTAQRQIFHLTACRYNSHYYFLTKLLVYLMSEYALNVSRHKLRYKVVRVFKLAVSNVLRRLNIDYKSGRARYVSIEHVCICSRLDSLYHSIRSARSFACAKTDMRIAFALHGLFDICKIHVDIAWEIDKIADTSHCVGNNLIDLLICARKRDTRIALDHTLIGDNDKRIDISLQFFYAFFCNALLSCKLYRKRFGHRRYDKYLGIKLFCHLCNDRRSARSRTAAHTCDNE